MEIDSGVYLLEGIKGANCYLIASSEGLYLIDTGMPGNAIEIIRQIRPDVLLKDNETAGPFKVIHTPGHTEGSVCFYYALKSMLFAGDALRTDKQGNPCFSPPVMNLNNAQAIRSVGKLKALDFRVMLPGHGRPLLEDASSKIAKLDGFGG